MWSREDIIKEGDSVILFASRDSLDCVRLEADKGYNCKHGYFLHSDIIGQLYGSQIIAKNQKGFLYALRPTPELWTLALPHRTQIVYHPDISFVLASLDVKPGSKVIEAGTGSGSFTHSLARAVGTTGKVYSFEFHGERFEHARAEFVAHGLPSIVHLEHRDVIKEGFGLQDSVDAVFLDVPTPEAAICAAKDALYTDRLTRICCYSPCIEQVGKTVAELSKQGFSDIAMYETLVRNYDTVAAVLPKVQTAVDRIGLVERNKQVRREKQIAAAAAQRAAKTSGTQHVEPPQNEPIGESAGDSNHTPAAAQQRESGKPSATRKSSDRAASYSVAAAFQSGQDEQTALAPRPLYQTRGHTAYLTFASLLAVQPKDLEVHGKHLLS